MPNGCVNPVEKDRSPEIRVLQNLHDPIRGRVSLFEILFFNLYEDSQDPSAIRERNKSPGIPGCSQPRFDADTHAVQQGDDGGSVTLGEIDGSIVRQQPPCRNAVSRPLFVAFDPRARRHSDKRSRACAPDSINRLIDGREALASVASASMYVEFCCPGRDTRSRVDSYGFGRKGQLGMKVTRTCAVNACLNNHIGSTSERRIAFAAHDAISPSANVRVNRQAIWPSARSVGPLALRRR
jgi:hypothetical protein